MAVKSVIGVLLLLITKVTSYCEVDHIKGCTFKIHCFQTLEEVELPLHCLNSTRAPPLFIDLFLSDDVKFDNVKSLNFLESAKSLSVDSPSSSPALGILKFAPNIQNLYFTHNNIDEFENETPLFTNSELRFLDMSNNNLSYIDDLFVFGNGSNLKRINLAHNSIFHLPSDSFAQLNNLIELDLSYNIITDFSEEPFQNLTKLQILKLNNNNLKDISGALNGLINLKALYLRQNNLQYIDAGILSIIYNLEKFDISKNSILELSTDVFLRQWKGRKSLLTYDIMLAENNITVVPNTTIGVRAIRAAKTHDAKMITNLNISKNAISEIGYNAFHGINQLTSLDLSSNNLKDFIVNGEDLKHLKFLYLKNNVIKTLNHKELCPMTQLRFLDLSHNNFHNISSLVFIDNRKLRHVSLAYNKINNIGNDINLFHIDGGLLDLSNNNLNSVDIPYNETFRITTLVLRSNKINDMAYVNLDYHTSLKNLLVSKNEINHLYEYSLRLPDSLEHLDLNSNQITGIEPLAFKKLKNLQVLSISFNDISFLEYGVFHGLVKLRKLFISNNNLETFNADILRDLKSLEVLSVKNNNFKEIYNNRWFNHNNPITVYIDGNNLPCNELSTAVDNFDNGISVLKLEILKKGNVTSGPNIDGIPCSVQGNSEVMQKFDDDYNHGKEILVTNTKILEAIKNQTQIMQKFFSFLSKNNINKTTITN